MANNYLYRQKTNSFTSTCPFTRIKRTCRNFPTDDYGVLGYSRVLLNSVFHVFFTTARFAWKGSALIFSFIHKCPPPALIVILRFWLKSIVLGAAL